MASKIRISTTIFHVPVMVMIVATILICSNVVLCDDTVPVPADISQLNNWFNQNVGSLNQRKSELDPALVAAESNVTVIKVMQDGSGAFKSIGDALKTIPTGNTRRVILYIGGGTYNEKIKIDRTMPFITFFGDPANMPNITFGGTAQQFGTVDSATLIVESDYFTACNIMIANNAPRPDGKKVGAQAVAMRISGDKASFYNCKLYGFQDTLCDDRNRHLFKDCLIQGTVDFIFGSGKSLYLNTELRFVGDGVIVAQARMSDKEDTGYSFVHCTVDGTGSGTGPGSLLGRAWMSHPKVVFAYCTMTNIVDPQGWSDNMHPDYDKTVFFGEYKNTGAGANVAQRKMSTQLSDANAAPFIRLGFIQASKWLLPPPTPQV